MLGSCQAPWAQHLSLYKMLRFLLWPDLVLRLEATPACSCVFNMKGTPEVPTKHCEGCALRSSSAGWRSSWASSSPAPMASVHISLRDSVLVRLGLGPELLPWVGGFLCWHHFQPLLIISSKAINLLQVGVFPFVLQLKSMGFKDSEEPQLESLHATYS